MDDTRTNETLDALADLFLTGVSPPRKAPQRIPPKSRDENDAEDGDASASSEAKSSANTAIEQLDGPATLAMNGDRSHLAPRDGTPLAEREDYGKDDSKPAMRLTSDYDDAPLLPVHVEAVFLGNLPGFGGPWLSQYAFALAQQRGPVGVLHLSGDQLDLELVTAERHAIRAGIDEPLRSVADGEVLVKRLHRLSRDLDLPVTNWLIHLPSPPQEDDLAAAAALSHWTVLCGADDAAIAGATRLVQQLVQGAADHDEANEQTPEPHLIGVAVMGSDEGKAREAIGKFNAAATGFLKQPVELVASRKQMTPVYLRVIGTFQDDDLWAQVQSFLDEQPVASPDELAAPPAVVEHAPPVDESPEFSLPTDTEALRDEAQSASRSPAMPQVADPVEEVESQEHAPSMEPVVTARAMPRGMPRSSNTPKAATSSPEAAISGEPDLAALIVPSMGGGLPLDARYPKQPQTQLLLDQDGCIHLLRRQAAGELRAAIVDLIEVRDWVREHMELIALTQRQCKFNAKAEPVLHLFTGEAKTAASMVSKLGPFVKLHLLQEVRIGSQGTWVCTDLN